MEESYYDDLVGYHVFYIVGRSVVGGRLRRKSLSDEMRQIEDDEMTPSRYAYRYSHCLGFPRTPKMTGISNSMDSNTPHNMKMIVFVMYSLSGRPKQTQKIDSFNAFHQKNEYVDTFCGSDQVDSFENLREEEEECGRTS